jgi:hypothetical protein
MFCGAMLVLNRTPALSRDTHPVAAEVTTANLREGRERASDVVEFVVIDGLGESVLDGREVHGDGGGGRVVVVVDEAERACKPRL